MRRILLAYLLFAAACGDDGNRHIVDAPPVSPDSPNIDAAETPVTVTVTRDGAPVVGITVYFQNPDGTVAGMPVTDGTGTASHVVMTGGSVTAVDDMLPPSKGGPTAELSTWLGVKPGDHLLLSSGAPPAAVMDITIPTDANHGTITSYSLYTSCTDPAGASSTLGVAVGSGAPTSLLFSGVPLTGCNGTVDLLVVANGANNDPASALFVPAQTVTDGGALDLTAQANNYTVANQHTYHVTNYAGGAALTITDWIASNRGVVFRHDLQASGNPIDTVANLPEWTGSKRFLELFEPSSSLTDRHYLEWGNLDPYSTDYAMDQLPEFTAAPMLDTATHVVSWTQSGGTQTPDLAVASVSATRANMVWRWAVIGVGPTSLTLPTLPAGSFDYNVAMTDTFRVETLSTGKAPGGYDAVRATAFAASGPQSFVTGASGSLISNDYMPVLLFQRPHALSRPVWYGGPARALVAAPRARSLVHRAR